MDAEDFFGLVFGVILLAAFLWAVDFLLGLFDSSIRQVASGGIGLVVAFWPYILGFIAVVVALEIWNSLPDVGPRKEPPKSE